MSLQPSLFADDAIDVATTYGSGPGPVIAGAVISPCGLYRYQLFRRWEPVATARMVTFALLNPSKADALIPDPTMTRCMGYAKAWGYGGFYIVNLFAFRATDPADMKAAADPIGPENDRWLVETARASELVVLGWGAHGGYRGRDRQVVAMLSGAGVPLHYLTKTKGGQPGHPLFLRGDLRPVGW